MKSGIVLRLSGCWRNTDKQVGNIGKQQTVLTPISNAVPTAYSVGLWVGCSQNYTTGGRTDGWIVAWVLKHFNPLMPTVAIRVQL